MKEEIVKGLRVFVEGLEVAELATKQAERCRQKVEKYTEQRTKMTDAGAAEEPVAVGTSFDALRDLGQRIAENTERAAFFAFVADHIDETATYELGMEDLRTLGVTKEYFR